MNIKGSKRTQVKAVAAPVQKGLFHGLEKGTWHRWLSEEFIFILKFILGLTLFLAVCNVNAQTFTLQKTVSNTTPAAGVPFNYILNASCNSSTQDCETAIIRDTLPPELEFLNFSTPLPDGVGSATYDIASHSIMVTFDATSCTSCTPDGINTDNDDFAQGSTIQLLIQVKFPNGTFNGLTADNTAYGTSVNAGNPIDNAATVTATGGSTPQTGCNQFVIYQSSTGTITDGGLMYIRVKVANDGLSDIDNWTSITDIPGTLVFEELYTPHIPNLDHTGTIFYERSDQPGTWYSWTSFNVDTEERLYVTDLGLPIGVTITSIKLEMGTLSGDGSWNQGNFVNTWDPSLRIYAYVNAPVGSVINSCTDFSGDVNGNPCTGTSCTNTDIINAVAQLTGGKEIKDLNDINANTFSPGDKYLVELHYASDDINDQNVLGGVLVDVLPPGMTYVPNSWYYAWDVTGAIGNIQPVVQTGFLTDGRQWVRFVYDSSLGNEFTIVPDGTWHGIGITFEVQISVGVTPGWYTNEYYFSSTGSDHGCDGTSYSGPISYLGGYSYDDTYCSYTADLEIVWAPGSAGLDAYKESKGSLDLNYSRYPLISNTTPGGVTEYKLVISNPNATPINNIVVYDIFPYVGDTEIMNISVPRFSEWRPILAEAIIPPAGITVEYSTDSNPCRDELAGSNPTPFPSGCNTVVWSSTPPSNITSVRAVRFDFNTVTLTQGQSVEIYIKMATPVNVPATGEVAWNSFAYSANNATTSTSLLPAEPIKVGIQTASSSPAIFGDWVWNDINGNGVQNAIEPGVDGVIVSLYQDDGDLISEPGTDDTFIASTITNNGGYYQFTNLPSGDYFVEFTNLPVGFSETLTDADSEFMDSDSLITPVTYLSTNETDLTNDLGIIGNFASCDLNIDNIVVTPCSDENGHSIAYIDVTVSWNYAPPGEDIIIRNYEKTDTIFVTQGATSPYTIQISEYATGYNSKPMAAHFSGGLCFTEMLYNLPPPCDTEICDNAIDDDGDGLPDSEDFGCLPGCFIASDANEILTRVNDAYTVESYVGNYALEDVEAIEFDPNSDILYASLAGELYILDQWSAAPTLVGDFSPLKDANGTQGIIDFHDVDGLARNPISDVWYAVARREDGVPCGLPDVLFQFDPLTGLYIPGAFPDLNGDSQPDDYVVIQQPSSAPCLHLVDDLGFDPYSGKLYGIANGNDIYSNQTSIVQIDPVYGSTTDLGNVVYDPGTGPANIMDAEGLTITLDGNVLITTGNSGPFKNTLYQLSGLGTGGTITATKLIDLTYFDIEAITCMVYSNPATVGDFIYFDEDGNGMFNGLDTGIENVIVHLLNNSTGDTLGTTLTDINGIYLFDGLPPGTYDVVVGAENFSTGGVLEFRAQSDDPDATLDNFGTTIYLDAGDQDLTMDFGYIEISEICNDGIDNDGDGLIDSEDPDCPIIEPCTCSDNKFTNPGFESGAYNPVDLFITGVNGMDLGYDWNVTGTLTGWGHGQLWWIDTPNATEGSKLVYINNPSGGPVCTGQYYDLGYLNGQVNICDEFQICFDWASFNRAFPTGRTTTSQPEIDLVWFDSANNVLQTDAIPVGTPVANQDWNNIIWSSVSYNFTMTRPVGATVVRVNLSEASGFDNGILLDNSSFCVIVPCVCQTVYTNGFIKYNSSND